LVVVDALVSASSSFPFSIVMQRSTGQSEALLTNSPGGGLFTSIQSVLFHPPMPSILRGSCEAEGFGR
jgi:hypothetical protein